MTSRRPFDDPKLYDLALRFAHVQTLTAHEKLTFAEEVAALARQNNEPEPLLFLLHALSDRALQIEEEEHFINEMMKWQHQDCYEGIKRARFARIQSGI